MGRLLSFDGGNDGYEHLGFVYKVLCFTIQKTNMALEKTTFFQVEMYLQMVVFPLSSLLSGEYVFETFQA